LHPPQKNHNEELAKCLMSWLADDDEESERELASYIVAYGVMAVLLLIGRAT
jgi:hypothetical protein